MFIAISQWQLWDLTITFLRTTNLNAHCLWKKSLMVPSKTVENKLMINLKKKFLSFWAFQVRVNVVTDSKENTITDLIQVLDRWRYYFFWFLMSIYYVSDMYSKFLQDLRYFTLWVYTSIRGSKSLNPHWGFSLRKFKNNKKALTLYEILKSFKSFKS